MPFELESVPHWVRGRPGCFRAADDREWQTRPEWLDHAINHLRHLCRPTRPLVRALSPCRPKTSFSLVVQYPDAVQRRRSAPPLFVHRHIGGEVACHGIQVVRRGIRWEAFRICIQGAILRLEQNELRLHVFLRWLRERSLILGLGRTLCNPRRNDPWKGGVHWPWA